MSNIDIADPGVAAAALTLALQNSVFGFAQDEATTTGLTYGYTGGIVRNPNFGVVTIAAGTVDCGASATTYIWCSLDDTESDLVVQSGAVLQDGAFAIASVVTDESAITSVTDLRSFIPIEQQFCPASRVTTVDGENGALPTPKAGFHIITSSGGTTPTKTLPDADALAAAAIENGWRCGTSGNVGDCVLRIRNKNSGNLTVAGGADTDTSGATLVIPTNKYRDYSVTVFIDDPYGAEITDVGAGDV